MAKKSSYIDLLTIVSSFAVIMLHCNQVFWTHPTGSLWASSLTIEVLFYFAVPVFFMVSGATLMDYRERYSTMEFFRKRFWRTVFPFFFWSFIYFLIFASHDYSGKSLSGIARTVISSVINYKQMSWFWFFYPLFALYLSIPLFSNVKDKIKTFTYVIIYAFISYSLLPFILNFFDLKWRITALYAPVAAGYVIYLLGGYVLSRISLPRKYRIILYAAGTAGVLLHIFGTDHYSPPGMPISTIFKGYLNFPTVLQSAAIFVFFKETDWEKLPLFCHRLINFIKPHTLGIYLLHGAIIKTIMRDYPALTRSIYYRTFGAIVIFFICLTITMLISKIPYLRMVVGTGIKSIHTKELSK